MAKKTTRSKAAKNKQKAGGSNEKYNKAVDGLEKAVKALYKGDAQRAKEQLERLAATYPEEKELIERVDSYLKICARQLAPQRRPKTAEEMVTFGVMYLNEGDAARAIKHLSKAIELEPKSSHVQYCLAAAHALSGDAPASAKYLQQAINSDPTSRFHARGDEDFNSVRREAEVAALLADAQTS